MYSVRVGESISDCVLNSTGDITNWNAITATNFYPSWTPTLSAGDQVIIPDTVNINNQNLAVLNNYPANNSSVPDIFGQLYAIFNLLDGQNNSLPYSIPFILGGGSVPIVVTNAVLPEVDTNTYYTVRPTETISDAVLNGSGNIENWDSITATGFFDSWTPILYAGQKVAIPSTANMSLNTLRALNNYPANNCGPTDIYNQLIAIFDKMYPPLDNWILATGFWRGEGIWTTDGIWKA